MRQEATGGSTAGPDLFSAIGRHIVLFLIPIVVLAAAGIAYGVARKPDHKAEARISIGPLNAATQGLPGFANAATNLAAAYARTIDDASIGAAAGKAAKIPAGKAREEISASSIPETPLLRVEASDRDPKIAVKLANGAADALIEHVLELNRRANLRDEVLSKYRSAARSTANATKALRAQEGKPGEADARARRDVAQLRQQALGSIYGAAAAGEISQNLMQVVVRAVSAESDRSDVLKRWGLIGALAGVLLGLVLAASRETTLHRRRVAAAGDETAAA